jgi:hypothetical protein
MTLVTHSLCDRFSRFKWGARSFSAEITNRGGIRSVGLVPRISAIRIRTCTYKGWRPVSMLVMDVREIPTARAKSSCVSFAERRASRRRCPSVS